MSKRYPLVIQLQFEVPYFEDKSGMTDQEVADLIVAHIEEERKELVIEAKRALIFILAGEKDALKR